LGKIEPNLEKTAITGTAIPSLLNTVAFIFPSLFGRFSIMTDTYISLREFEKETLDEYISEEFGDTSRITAGAAIRKLAQEGLEE